MAWRLDVRAVAAGLVIFLISGAASADMVVVRVKGGAGLKPGQVIASGASVALPADSHAVLLSRDGRTVTLTGPYSGAVSEPEGSGAAGDAKSVTVLSRLVTASNSDSSALGVTRAGMFSSPYAISMAGGVHCQVAGEKVRFERELGSPEERVTVVAASGLSAKLVWAEGEALLDWPEKVPFAEGHYSIGSSDRPKPVKLTVKLVPAAIKLPGAIAIWMADHQCSTQASQILAGLR